MSMEGEERRHNSRGHDPYLTPPQVPHLFSPSFLSFLDPLYITYLLLSFKIPCKDKVLKLSLQRAVNVSKED